MDRRLLTFGIAGVIGALAGGSAASSERANMSGLAERLAGNTLRIANPLGSIYLQFSATGRYRQVSNARDGVKAGTWRVEGDKVCLRQTRPAPPASYSGVCETIGARSLGQTWTRAGQSEGVRMTLLEGHVGGGSKRERVRRDVASL